jgi:phosphoribosylglycinamide formyltransferase 1
MKPEPEPQLKLGVLISGSGTNLGAILSAIEAGRLAARVELVISNRADAFGLERAAKAGVATKILPHRESGSRELFDQALVAALQGAGVEWVVLAGFMRVVTSVLLDAFPDRVLNVHPALLPSFPGVDAQAQALAYGVKWTGCTVHFVDSGVDTGPVIVQKVVPVLADDDRETLAKRILAEEHQALVEALGLIAAGRIEVEPGPRRRVRVRS